jgi:hypothetical protein
MLASCGCTGQASPLDLIDGKVHIHPPKPFSNNDFGRWFRGIMLVGFSTPGLSIEFRRTFDEYTPPRGGGSLPFQGWVWSGSKNNRKMIISCNHCKEKVGLHYGVEWLDPDEVEQRLRQVLSFLDIPLPVDRTE